VAPLGVYVHFPYCTRRCPYCDFAVHARKRIPHDTYAAAVIRELEARASLFVGHAAVTAYFGGGTPGLWRPDALGAVLRAIRERLSLPDEAEVTVEVNPGETSEDHLRQLRDLGVNRLSIGAQSFDERSLQVLGRTHDASAARAAVVGARRAGFTNVSVDLMFGLPQATLAALDRELSALLTLETEHVSVYGLTIEPRTAFAALVKSGDLVLPPSEMQASLYERTVERLARAGFVHHEVSSWARPGFHARHNTLYWKQVAYLGLGSSASSLRLDNGGGVRFSNHRSVDRYLAADKERRAITTLTDDPRIAEVDPLSAEAFEREGLWLGLRLVAGIDRAAYERRFGRDPMSATPALGGMVRGGLVELDEAVVRLTPRGRLVADEVGRRLLEEPLAAL
jgi:oxygen-independent coproporphyrinogen-3 oxidase